MSVLEELGWNLPLAAALGGLDDEVDGVREADLRADPQRSAGDDGRGPVGGRGGAPAGLLERLKRGEVIQHFETVRMRRDGTLLDVSVTLSPIRDASGRITGASST